MVLKLDVKHKCPGRPWCSANEIGEYASLQPAPVDLSRVGGELYARSENTAVANPASVCLGYEAILKAICRVKVRLLRSPLKHLRVF